MVESSDNGDEGKGGKRGTNYESRRSISGNKEQGEDRGRIGRGFLDGKRSETRMSIESDAIQPGVSGFRGGDGKGEMWRDGTGGGRIFTLSYADDMVLIVEGEGDMRSMIEKLEGYIDRKGLEVNVGKTKIMRFRRGRGRKKKVNWR